MNLPKKLILLPTIALIFVGGSVAAYALKPEVGPKRVEVQQVAAVEPAEIQAAPVESPPAIVEPVEQEPAPKPPKTVGELQAYARQVVLDDGQNETQASCFEVAMDKRYGWGNATEESISSKFSELDDIYVGMCPALGRLFELVGGTQKAYDPDFVFPDTMTFPPGFRN